MNYILQHQSFIISHVPVSIPLRTNLKKDFSSLTSRQTQRSFLSSHFLTAVELLPLLTTPFSLKASLSPGFKYMRYHQSLILLLLTILVIIPRQIHLPLIPRLLLYEYTNMNKTDSGESHHLEEASWFICCRKRG